MGQRVRIEENLQRNFNKMRVDILIPDPKDDPVWGEQVRGGLLPFVPGPDLPSVAVAAIGEGQVKSRTSTPMR